MARVAIVGSRDYPSLDEVRRYVEALPADTEIVSGGALAFDAKGNVLPTPDTTAREVARERGMPYREFLPQYDRYAPKLAPLKRNDQIVEHADRLVAFWTGQSSGTAYTIRQARLVGKPVEIIRPSKANQAP